MTKPDAITRAAGIHWTHKSAMKIRKATEADIESIAAVYQACFPNELNHDLWIRASLSSYPKGVYYVVSIDDRICGYILWCVKNGFRDKTIVELEQIGIHPEFSGKGLGRKLIEDTVEKFREHVGALGHAVDAILVTTAKGNFAEKLYESTLGVSRAAELSNYGSGTELILYRQRVSSAKTI